MLTTLCAVGDMKEMGKSGGTHMDDKDYRASYTATTSLSDVDASINPGLFCVLHPRVFCRMAMGVTMNFSGLNAHGGVAPTGSEAKARDKRLVCAHFQPEIVGEGLSRYPLAATPDNTECIYTTHEMRFPE
jgi:hypothetical protein